MIAGGFAKFGRPRRDPRDDAADMAAFLAGADVSRPGRLASVQAAMAAVRRRQDEADDG